jgi:transcriptional regulator with XRE-family HTH domain
MKIYTYKGRNNLCGERVRQARVAKRITQADLAARLQLSGITIERDSVSRIEIGTRFVADYELKVLSEILGVSAEWLLEEE